MANSKRAAYFDAAQRLFIEDGLTRLEICEKLPVSDKTVRTWAAEGEWEKKRLAFRGRVANKIEDLDFIIEKNLASMRKDLEAGNDISDQRVYSLARMAEMLKNLQQAEKVKQSTPLPKTPGDPDKKRNLVDEVDEILGVRKDA